MPNHLLILDDQEDLLRIMERELSRRSEWAVSVATSTAQAFQILEKKSIQLVIADVRLGADSGFAFAQSLRQQRPDIGLILMSAYRSKTNHAEATAVGAFLFLEKPFPMSKLIQSIEKYFAQTARTVPLPAVPLPAPPLTEAAAKMLPATASLAHFEIQDLVQLFCLNGRAMVILVKSRIGNQTGSIYIQRGNVRHAEMGELTGDQAFYALLALPNSKLTVKEWDRPALQTITTSWEHLLLNAAVQNDHSQMEDTSQASSAG